MSRLVVVVLYAPLLVNSTFRYDDDCWKQRRSELYLWLSNHDYVTFIPPFPCLPGQSPCLRVIIVHIFLLYFTCVVVQRYVANSITKTFLCSPPSYLLRPKLLPSRLVIILISFQDWRAPSFLPLLCVEAISLYLSPSAEQSMAA
jgi:hypothetical protein